jgi:hypothetical protein
LNKKTKRGLQFVEQLKKKNIKHEGKTQEQQKIKASFKTYLIKLATRNEALDTWFLFL